MTGRNFTRRAVARALAVVLLLFAVVGAGGGCAAVPVAAAGTMVGMTASAVTTGSDIYRLGKLDAAEMAGFDESVAAARSAAADLGLREKKTEPRKGDAVRITFADDRNTTLTVRVEPRTASLVLIRIDVGWFGSQTTARLFLTRLRVHLLGEDAAKRVGGRADEGYE